MPHSLTRVAGVLLAALVSAPVMAAEFVYSFSGTVVDERDPDDVFFNGKHPGDTVSGTIRFDPTGVSGESDAPYLGGTRTQHGVFEPGWGFVDISVRFSNGDTFSPTSWLSSPDSVSDFTDLWNDASDGVVTFDRMEIQDRHWQHGELAYAVFTSVPASGYWPSSVLSSSRYGDPVSLGGVSAPVAKLTLVYGNSVQTYGAEIAITSVVAVVPEPSMFALAGVGLLLTGAVARRKAS